MRSLCARAFWRFCGATIALARSTPLGVDPWGWNGSEVKALPAVALQNPQIALFLESIFVGVYSSLVYYFCVKPWGFKPLLLVVFIVGVMKHFFGYILQLQTLYCSYGSACVFEPSMRLHNYHAQTPPVQLVIESTFEGFAFVLVFCAIAAATTQLHFTSLPAVARQNLQMSGRNSPNKLLKIMFLIGFILHLLAEITGIHKTFCLHRCVQN